MKILKRMQKLAKRKEKDISGKEEGNKNTKAVPSLGYMH